MRVVTVTPALPSEDYARTTAFIPRQLDSLRREGIDIDLVEIAGLSKTKYARSVIPVRERAVAADLVHAHYGFCGWVARCQKRRPVIVSFLGSDLLYFAHESPVNGVLHRLEIASNRVLARLVAAVIVKTQEMAATLGSVPAYVIPNGVDLEIFAPSARDAARAALGWEQRRRRVLFPGNPAQRRKAFPLARDAVDRASRVLGDEIEIVALSNVPADRVPTIMNACDAMILTSLAEGSPNVVKEAMACNLPIASVSVGDVCFLLDGVRRCRLTPRDPGALAAALVDLLSATEPSDGRAHLKRKGLDAETVARSLVAVYEEVVARYRRTA